MYGCSCLELERFLLLAPCPPVGADEIFWELMNDLVDDKTINRSILTYNETSIVAKHCNISKRIIKETVSPETTSAATLSAQTTSAASSSAETSVQSSFYIYFTIGIVCALILIALLIGMVKLKRYFYKRKVGEADTNVLEYSNISSQRGENINKPQSDGQGKQQNKNDLKSCTPDIGSSDIHVINQTNNEIPLVTHVRTLTSRDDK